MLFLALVVVTLFVKTICTSTVDSTFAVLPALRVRSGNHKHKEQDAPLRLWNFGTSTVGSILSFSADRTFRWHRLAPAKLPRVLLNRNAQLHRKRNIFPSALITLRRAFYSTALTYFFVNQNVSVRNNRARCC